MTAQSTSDTPAPLTYDVLRQAVAGSAAALRARTTLQPAGGPGTKVFPPTYAGALYATEKRRLNGKDEPVDCVVLDSVQSQANRFEEALQQAVERGRLAEAGCTLPVLEVDFSGADLLDNVGRITSLQAPHRAADAILRDSLVDGVPFRKSPLGEKLDHASLPNATPLFDICPTALVFGLWDSTGPKGGLGAKFQRAMVSEIVGINAVKGVRTSSRIDPLQIRAQAAVVPEGDSYRLAENAKEKGAVRPSEVNHGNIAPSIAQEAGGVTIDHAEMTTVLSLPALRRLRFPLNNQPPTAEVDIAGQTVLAALGLVAVTLATEAGFDLRSRCLLWPDEPLTWQLLAKPGEAPQDFRLTGDEALAILKDALASAAELGLTWHAEPILLTPDQKLVDLLMRSQQIAAAESPAEDS